MKKFFLSIFFFLILASVTAKSALAITYDLIAPSGELSRGQDIQFIINVDTEGTTITTAQVGMNYESGPLQYVGTTAGNAMTGVSVDQQTTGRFLLTGTNAAGFSGKGVFAYVTFKIIADAPGTATLCALWAPTTAPTAGPPATSSPLQPTTPPPPPPTPGSTSNTAGAILLGSLFLAATIGLYFYKSNITYDKKAVKKTVHKKNFLQSKKTPRI